MKFRKVLSGIKKPYAKKVLDMNKKRISSKTNTKFISRTKFRGGRSR